MSARRSSVDSGHAFPSTRPSRCNDLCKPKHLADIQYAVRTTSSFGPPALATPPSRKSGRPLGSLRMPVHRSADLDELRWKGAVLSTFRTPYRKSCALV